MAGARRTIIRALVTLMLVLVGILVMSIPRIVRDRRLAPPDLSPFTVVQDSGIVPPDSMPADSTRVIAALHGVEDPEVGFSIVELGLIHRLAVDSAGNASVVMALTMPECPFSRFLGEKAVEAIKVVPGVRRVKVVVDPTISWDPARLTGEAKARYDNVFGNDSGDSR